MSRVGYCVAVYLLVLAHAPASCLELPQQELGGPHLNPEHYFGELPITHELNEFGHPERFQDGFENHETFNKPGFDIEHGLRNTERLEHFEHQQKGQKSRPQLGQLNFQQGHNEQDILHRPDLNELDKSKNIHNYQLEHGEKGISPVFQPELQRFEPFRHKEKSLLKPNELNGLKNSQGLSNFEHGQQQQGLLEGVKSKTLNHNFRQEKNSEGLLQSDELNGFKNSQGLLNFEHEAQSKGFLNGLNPKTIRKFDLGLEHEANEGIGQISKLNGFDKVQGTQNVEFGQQANGFLQSRKFENQIGFEQLGLGQESKQEGLLPSIELNGLKKSQGVRNFEIGQQQSGLLHDIQSEGRQQFIINDFGSHNDKEKRLLQENQIKSFNNVQGLRNLELREQQNGLQRTQNINLQGHAIQANKYGIIKNPQKQRNIQLGQQQGNIRFNEERQNQEIELQKDKRGQPLLSHNFNTQLNRQGFAQPIQTNPQNVQEINRFTQPPGFQQPYPYNRLHFPHHFNFNGNQPDKATVQKMIEDAHILAQNLRKIQLNLKNPVPLTTAPFPSSPLKLAWPNIGPNNAESFSVNVQPVSQSNGQSVVKFNQINSQALKAELENADKILLKDLARRGFRINEVTHKLEKIPGVTQVNHVPIIQTAPIGQPDVLRAISSAEGALEKTVSQVSASTHKTANADSSSQLNLPPAVPTILTTADLSSILDRPGQVYINVGKPSIEPVPGQVISQSTASTSQSPSSAVSEGTINGISTTLSATDNQQNPSEILIDRTTLPLIENLPGTILSGSTYNTAGSHPSSVSVSTMGSGIASPNILDLPGQVIISSRSPSTESSVSISTSSSPAGGQSGPVSVAIDGNTFPDLPGREIIGTTSSSIQPVSVSASTLSTGGKAGQVVINGATTVSASKKLKLGAVQATLGSNTSPSAGDLPAQVVIDTTTSTAGNPKSVNSVSSSSSPSGRQSGSVAINGVTTTSSSKEDQSVTVGSNSATPIRVLPGQMGIDTTTSSVSSSASMKAINTNFSSITGQSVTIDGETTILSPTGSDSVTLGNTASPIVKDFPAKVIVTSKSPSTNGSVSINTVSSSSSFIGDQSGQVINNGGMITTFSKKKLLGPVTVTVGSEGSSGQLTIDSSLSSTGSPLLVNSVSDSSATAGEKVKLPLRSRIKHSSTTSPKEINLGSTEENTGKITINGVNNASSSSPVSGYVTITDVNNDKSIIDEQRAKITSTGLHPLPGFDTELGSADIVTTISNSSFSASNKEDSLADSQDSQQNRLLINKRHSRKSKSSDMPIVIPKRILKQIDQGAHNKHRMSQLITAPKNSGKLFQMILKFNSTLDRYISLYGNETQGVNTRHKPLIELPWDKENLGPAAFINKYLSEEWHSNVTNEIEESGRIHSDSRYRKPNSHAKHAKGKGFIIDGNELIPVEKTTILPGSSVDNNFDWTGTEHANSCHGDCNAEPACGYTCGRTCVDYKEPSRFCNRHEECNVGVCQCKPGFVLDLNTNRCIHPDQCSQCGPNEYLDECPDLCMPEECPSRRPQKDCISNDRCPKPVCRCIINYRRNKDDFCIPIQQCPKLKCHGPNEVFSPCAREDLDEDCTSGLPDCFTSKIQNQSPVICIPRCTCAPGHLRNSYDECVPVDQCSSTSHRKTQEKHEIEDETTEEEVIEV